jgi:hypothetical protein
MRAQCQAVGSVCEYWQRLLTSFGSGGTVCCPENVDEFWQRFV